MQRGIKARAAIGGDPQRVEPAVRIERKAQRAPPLLLEHQRVGGDAAGAGRSGGILP